MSWNNAAHEVCRRVRSSVPDLLDKSGSVLYSSAETLRLGDLYVVGLNPGGHGGDSLGARLDSLPSRTTNEYLDAEWGSEARAYGPGEHPFQKRLAWFVRELGYDLRSVCASNLIFTRSVGQGGAGYPGRADACWPVHELLLSIVKPRAILAIGNGATSPFAYLRSKLGGGDLGHVDAGHGSWSCKAFCTRYGGRALVVIGLPHLSRYDIAGKGHVVEWATGLVDETGP